ncbi:MAG: family 10 glycosylhydrolase [Bacteroidales bacterium]
MKNFLITLLISVCMLPSMAQMPKSEMRATWLATVYSLDWPNTKISNTGNLSQINSQKNSMIRILDSLQRANVNSLCFQVRSRCDAMYKSSYEPWSSDLVATRGLEPGYDPLEFVIQESHKRGIQVHAWLNPYRFESSRDAWLGQMGDYRESNPEWVMIYEDGKSILDPGQPGVKHLIKSIVGEIVNNYDVDGIIFDDYFYAYGGTPSSLDQATQNQFKPQGVNLSDWRRDNVNRMVEAVYDTIQSTKPFVTFGVSPFGIWTTDRTVAEKEGITLPNGITGSNMYETIYCDPVAWLKDGTVDYISPQLYWETTSTGQDYDVLCPWWSDLANRFNRHFYSSHSISNLTATYQSDMIEVKSLDNSNREIVNPSSLSNMERSIIAQINSASTMNSRFGPSEVLLQVDRNRASDKNGAPGSIFYSTKNFYLIKGFIDYMRRNVFSSPALRPSINWKMQQELGLVDELKEEYSTLSWSSPVDNVCFVVYAIPNSEYTSPKQFAIADYMLRVSYENEFQLPQGVSSTTHKLAVSILDRFGNEYSPRVLGDGASEAKAAILNYPLNDSKVVTPAIFSWENNSDAVGYYYELSSDADFSELLSSRFVEESSFNSANISSLKENSRYYWRVRSRFINHVDLLSEVRSFTTAQFQILSPTNGEKSISLTPLITWNSVSDVESYFIEIATTSLFESSRIVFTSNSSEAKLEIPEKTLTPNSTYYVRVSAIKGDGNTITTNTVGFETIEQSSKVPQILSPKSGDTILGDVVEVTWTEDVAPGYRVELCANASFPSREIKIKTTSAYVFNTEYTGLTPNKYYIRVKAIEGSGYTANSEVVEINLDLNTSIGGIDKDAIYVSQSGSGDISLIFRGGVSQETTFRVLNSQGSILYTQSVNAGNEFNLPIKQSSAGIYLVEIISANENKIIKFKKN